MRRSLSSAWVCVAAGLCVAAPMLARPSPADDDRSYRAGIGMLTKGLNDLAATELRTYLREHPDGAQATNARYSLAVCLVWLGNHAEAARELEPVLAVKGFEFAPDALLLHAQCQVAAGEDAAAAATLQELVKSFPDFAQLDRASAMLGESLYRVGKFKEAKETLAGAAARWPKSPLAERTDLLCAMAQRALGDLAGAAELAAKLRARVPHGEYASNAALIAAQCRHDLKDLPAAAALYERASTDGKGVIRIEALLGLARVSRATGDLPRAEQALSEAVKAPLPAGSSDLGERVAVERGKLLLEQGQTDAAFKVFAKAQTSNSASVAADAAYWAAKCQIKLGKFDDAAEHLSLAAARHAESDLAPDMLFERAAALTRAGKDADALEAWAQWRAKFQSHELAPDALLAEAWCAHRLGELDHSRELCGTLAKTHPARAGDESVQLLVAENEYAADHFEPALQAYAEFLDHHPKSQHAWRAGVRRGLALARLGRDDAAAKALEPLLASRQEDQDPSLRRAALTTLGDRAFAKQDWARAEQWFAGLAAETKDDSPDALLRQGICIQRQGRFAEALPLFERVIKDRGDSPQALQAQFESGQSLVELGRLDDARAALEQVVAKEKASGGEGSLAPHALRHLASIASRQGRPEDAAEILSKLGSNGDEGSSGATLLELGSAWLAAGKYADAEKTFTRFLDSPGAGPKRPDATIRRAIAVNRQGRHADAIQQLDSVGDSTALDPELRASAKYEWALALRSLGRDPEAAEAFKRLLEDAPSRLESYAALDLAQIESKAQHHDEALTLVTRSLSAADRLEKNEADAVRERATYLRAACLLHLAKPADAVEALKDFETHYPKSQLLRSVQLIRGEALLSTGRAKDAAAEFSLAAAPLSAGDLPDVRAAAMLRLGDALAASQDWTRSDQAFTAYLDSFPNSELWFQAKFGQGWARENQGRHDAALESYAGVVSRHKGPTAGRAQFQIGECLYAQKKHEQAVAELLKTDVLFAYPQWSAAALYEAGRCLAEMGRQDDAAKQFDDLTKRFPDSQWAKLAKERSGTSAPAPIPGRPRAAAPKAR